MDIVKDNLRMLILNKVSELDGTKIPSLEEPMTIEVKPELVSGYLKDKFAKTIWFRVKTPGGPRYFEVTFKETY